MKLYATLLLLLGATALTLPAQAQKKPIRKTNIRVVDPAKYSSTGYELTVPQTPASGTREAKLSRRNQQKLTPYAQAVLNNELLREEPAKSNENGVF